MELNPTADLIRSLEGNLVRITTTDGYEMVDYYVLTECGSLFLTSNQCKVKMEKMKTIQWIKDYGGYSDDAFYAMIESTKEH